MVVVVFVIIDYPVFGFCIAYGPLCFFEEPEKLYNLPLLPTPQ